MRPDLLLAVVIAAAASGVGAQTPRIETLGSFPWDGSTGSVLLQRVSDDRIVVQLRIVAGSQTSAGRVQRRTFQTDAVEAWVLLDDGNALEQLPRQPPKGAPPVGVGNAGDLYAFVSFGFKTPPGPEMVAVVVSVDGRHHVYALPAKSGAERAASAGLRRAGAQQPSAEPVTPLITQPRLIRWPLSDGIQAVTLMDQQTFLKVDLAGQSVPEGRGAAPVAPSPDGLQVWVLRKDGTVVSRRSPMREAAWGSMGGWATRTRELTFAHATFQDLAGVIVRVNGNLLVREMPPPSR